MAAAPAAPPAWASRPVATLRAGNNPTAEARASFEDFRLDVARHDFVLTIGDAPARGVRVYGVFGAGTPPVTTTDRGVVDAAITSAGVNKKSKYESLRRLDDSGAFVSQSGTVAIAGFSIVK